MKNKLIKILSLTLVFFQMISILTACKFDFFGNNDYEENVPTHTHTYTSTVKEPTCIRQGYTLYECFCGEEYKDKYVAPLGHYYKNYANDNNATCEDNATKTAKCERCSETDTVTIFGSKLGHSFRSYQSNGDATYEKDGTKTAKCERIDCNATDTITDVGSKLIRNGVTFNTFSVVGNIVSGKVSNSQSVFSFESEVVVHGEASYELYYDEDLLNAVGGTTVELNEGYNVIYLYEITNDDNVLYTVTIYRAHTYRVSFVTGFSDIVINDQIVEEGLLAISPGDIEKLGYIFTGWNFDFSTRIFNDIVIYATWNADINTPYTVAYYLQDIWGNYYEYSSSICYGETESIVYANIVPFKGFTAVDSEVYDYVKADGSTVLNVYYTRDSYEIIFDGNGGTLVSGSDYQLVKYENYATVPTFEKVGYEFVGWSCDVYSPITESFTAYAIWEIKLNYNYAVEYYLEDFNSGSYSLYNTEFYNGDANSYVSVTPTNIEHFTFNEYHALNKLSGYINGDGSTVFKLYYSRNLYVVSCYDESMGRVDGAGSYKYGKQVTLTAQSYLGYEFDGWYNGNVLLCENSTYEVFVDRNITAKFSVAPEMADFTFKSTATTCEISDVKNTLLTETTIPDYVTSIGSMAFYGCTSLRSIEIPNSVTSIGSRAFYGCTNLESITLPFVGNKLNGTSYTHFGYIFGASNYDNNSSCVPSSLKTVVITGGNSIGSYAFKNCIYITDVTIDSSIESVSSYAFNGCKITTATVPTHLISRLNKTTLETLHIEGGTSIPGTSCFGYSKLTTVTIGDSVESIGSECFLGTPLYNDTNNYDEYGVLYVDNWLIKAPSEISGDYQVREGTVGIAANAFYNCANLTSVTISDSVKYINNQAFAYCYALKTVTVGADLESINDKGFYGCDKITTFNYNGTTSDWQNVSKGESWNGYFIISEVKCSNGNTSL